MSAGALEENVVSKSRLKKLRKAGRARWNGKSKQERHDFASRLGIARKEALTPEQRSEIAIQGVVARMIKHGQEPSDKSSDRVRAAYAIALKCLSADELKRLRMKN